ncbi:MAG: hypothetical protein AAFX81_09785 [Pseudomonadota bacterium]
MNTAISARAAGLRTGSLTRRAPSTTSGWRVATFLLPAAFLLLPASAGAQETPLDVVAAAVRVEGHACTKPQFVSADPAESGPDDRVWTLDCESGRYRVTFDGDSRPRVERLGG